MDFHKKRQKRIRERKRKEKRRKIRRRFFTFVFFALIIFVFLYKKGPQFVEFMKNKELPFSKVKSEEELLREDLDLLLDIINNEHSIAFLNSHYGKIDLQKLKNQYEVRFEKEEDEFVPLLENILAVQKDPNSFLLDTGSLEEFASLDKESKEMKSFFLDETVKENARSIPFPLKEASNLELTTPVPGNTASIRLNSFDERNIQSDGEKIRSFLEQIEDYNLLIIDIRGADGYSIDYFLENLVQPFLQKELSMKGEYLYKNETFEKYLTNISKYLTLNTGKPLKSKDHKYSLSQDLLSFFDYYRTYEITIKPENFCHYHGKIYILQDHKTKNAADLFSQFANATGFATTCGEYTGGFGLNLLPSFVKLPNTEYIVSFSSRLGINPDGTINPDIGTEPKIKLENEDTFKQLIQIIH